MATQNQQPIITGAGGNNVMPRNDEQLANGGFPVGNSQSFNVPEMNQVTNQTGVIPADQILTNQRVTIPNVNLSQTAPDAQQALTEGEQQVAQQTQLQQLTDARMRAQQEQRLEQSALVSALGDNAGEIQSLFQQNEQAIAPIEQDVMNLNSLIQMKTSALRQQLIGESGRPIPQAFITGRKALIQQRASAEIADLGALLDAKNGQMELAQRKLDRSLQIQREVNNAEIQAKQVKIDILKEITGESKEEEQNELNRLKEEADRKYKEMQAFKQLIVDNAGVIPTKIAQDALLSNDPDAGFNKILPYLGQEQRLNLAIKSAQLSKAKSTSAQASGLSSKDVTALKTLEGASDLKNAVQKYKQTFEEGGNKVKKKGRASAQDIETVYQEVLQSYRNAVDLGALQGADINLVNSFVKEATFLRNSKKAQTQSPGFEVDRIGGTKAKASKASEASINSALQSTEDILARESAKIATSRPDLVNTAYYDGLINGFEVGEEITPDVEAVAGINGLRETGASDDDIIEYSSTVLFPSYQTEIQELYNQGYSVDEIISYVSTI